MFKRGDEVKILSGINKDRVGRIIGFWRTDKGQTEKILVLPQGNPDGVFGIYDSTDIEHKKHEIRRQPNRQHDERRITPP